jgi:hypothetical protein
MIEIIDCEQNSPEWFEARRGLPTASKFSTILASGKDGGASLTRAKYLRELAAEIITGDPTESYSNGFMERGHAQEADARDLYVFLTENIPQRVGFVRNGSKGCSPDSLIGNDGALEIKTMKGDLLIEILFKDKFPPAHVAQCQGVLWVAEREWIDIAIYTPKLPLFVKRAHRDEAYIANLSRAVDQFNEELAGLVERVRAYGGRAL